MERRIECIVRGNMNEVKADYAKKIEAEAERIGITGMIEDRGSVYRVIAEGDEELLKRFITFLYEGVSGVHVVDVETLWYDTKMEFLNFKIKEALDEEDNEAESSY
ncbi:MAG TPA: acylphosphatase [Candidatus Paceibacterota bacterium]|nr:acylphosphatase [Candidatus Paceibacterota bacterium]